MWPWGHLAAGYLLHSIGLRYGADRVPSGWPVVAVAVGTQLPDLVDKPLTYSVGVLPAGRSLLHAVVVVGAVALLTLAVAARLNRWAVGVGFAVGLASHTLADAIQTAIWGEPSDLTFLAWPFLPAPPGVEAGYDHHLAELLEAIGSLGPSSLLQPWTDAFVFELWFTALVAGLWVYHGLPPLDPGGNIE